MVRCVQDSPSEHRHESDASTGPAYGCGQGNERDALNSAGSDLPQLTASTTPAPGHGVGWGLNRSRVAGRSRAPLRPSWGRKGRRRPGRRWKFRRSVSEVGPYLRPKQSHEAHMVSPYPAYLRLSPRFLWKVRGGLREAGRSPAGAGLRDLGLPQASVLPLVVAPRVALTVRE